MSAVPAHWDEIGKAVALRDRRRSETLIVGNGDVDSLRDAREKTCKWGVDGVMIGRGALENPWVFGNRDGSRSERLNAFSEHIKLWRATWGESRHAAGLKKFAKAYIRNWEGAGALRAEIMKSATLEEMEQILEREN
jgi:tRNA-dihydrouridine synthase